MSDPESKILYSAEVESIIDPDSPASPVKKDSLKRFVDGTPLGKSIYKVPQGLRCVKLSEILNVRTLEIYKKRN